MQDPLSIEEMVEHLHDFKGVVPFSEQMCRNKRLL